MRVLRSLIVVALVLGSALPAIQAQVTPRGKPSDVSSGDVKSVDSPLVLKVGTEEIKVHFGPQTLYIPERARGNLTEYLFGDVGIYLSHNGKPLAENKYFKVGDETKTIRFLSNYPEVVEVWDKQRSNYKAGHLRIITSGKTVITVACDDALVQIPLEVLRVPLRTGATVDDIISTLGIPDEKYTSNTGKTEFWEYKKYPGHSLVLVPGETLIGTRSVDWYALSHGRIPKASSSTSATQNIQGKAVHFTGSKSRKTAPFSVLKKAKVTWSVRKTENGIGGLVAALHNADTGSIEDSLISTTEPGGETTYIYKPGTYYLDITASGEYDIQIEEM